MSGCGLNDRANGGFILSHDPLFVIKLYDTGLQHLLFRQSRLPSNGCNEDKKDPEHQTGDQ